MWIAQELLPVFQLRKTHLTLQMCIEMCCGVISTALARARKLAMFQSKVAGQAGELFGDNVILVQLILVATIRKVSISVSVVVEFKCNSYLWKNFLTSLSLRHCNC